MELQNFLFFCDIGNVLIGIGLWLESPADFFVGGVRTVAVSDAVHGRSQRARCSLDIISLEARNTCSIRTCLCGFVCLSLFHVVTPPFVLLWAIMATLGYDRRGWKLQTLTTWIVVPINYFWRPEEDVNWARGLFFHEQHALPGFVYLLGI